MYKSPITISLNPTYYCNMQCGWCYLTTEQLRDKSTVLDLSVLEDRLVEVMSEYDIGAVELYGGEITQLPESYQKDLYELLEQYDIPYISVITNYTRPDAYILQLPKVHIAVSYDGPVRENHERVMRSMQVSEVPLSILTLVSRDLLDTITPEWYVETLNTLDIMAAELLPYSSNQANQHTVRYTEYEDFVRAVIDHPDRQFKLTNVDYITECIQGTRNAYSNDHIYITPKGEFAILDFDDLGREQFVPVEDIEAYQEWTRREVTLTDEGLCLGCEYRGRCLSEHLHVVHTREDSCNGFYNLIKTYDDIQQRYST